MFPQAAALAAPRSPEAGAGSARAGSGKPCSGLRLPARGTAALPPGAGGASPRSQNKTLKTPTRPELKAKKP